MKRRSASAFILLSVIPVLVLAWNPFAPKVTFMRKVPASNNLGPLTSLAIVEMGGSESLEFSRQFKAGVASDRVFTLTDATRDNASLSKLTGNEKVAREFRKSYPADVYIGVNVGGCFSNLQSAVRQEKQKDKSYISKTYYWYVANCSANVRLIEAQDGRELASYMVTSDDKGAESETMYGFEAAGVKSAALRKLVDTVRASFTPRNDKEGIVLDKKAPRFKEAMQRIKSSNIPEAKRIWEEELASNSGSAALHHNLGAVSEALGDAETAREHYMEAIRLAPGEKRFREELARLEQREKDKAALLVRP